MPSSVFFPLVIGFESFQAQKETSGLRMRSRAVTHALLSLIQILKVNYTSNLEPFV